MASLTVTGSNPYEFEFVGANQFEMAKGWKIEKAPNSTCLVVAASPVAGSEQRIWITEVTQSPTGTTIRMIGKRVPQKINVTLECGTCTCGESRSVTVSTIYGPQDTGTIVDSAPSVVQVMKISCAGSDCENAIELAYAYKQISLPASLRKLLSAEQINQLLEGEEVNLSSDDCDQPKLDDLV